MLLKDSNPKCFLYECNLTHVVSSDFRPTCTWLSHKGITLTLFSLSVVPQVKTKATLMLAQTIFISFNYYRYWQLSNQWECFSKNIPMCSNSVSMCPRPGTTGDLCWITALWQLAHPTIATVIIINCR